MIRFILNRQMSSSLVRTATQVERGPVATLAQQSPPWQVFQQFRRFFNDKAAQLTEGEKAIVEKLRSQFPGATSVEVSDISGGCGAMYQIAIEAEEFRGKKTVAQHRLVNQVLAEEIKEMHGLQLTTKVPDKAGAS